MRNCSLITVAVLLCGGPVFAEETTAKSRISFVGLFKNGLAVVKREFLAPGPGTYRLDDVPEPVHGTYWVESKATIESAVQMRDIEVATEATGNNLQEELAGKKVTIYFRSDKLTPLAGTVLPPPKREVEETAAHAGDLPYGYRSAPEPASHFLILQTARGRAYVERGDIAYYEAQGVNVKVKRRKPVLLLTVAQAKGPTAITVTYLAHGLAWAPSYRVDTTDAKRLTLEQSAVVKNEMADLSGAEVSLITGFPSVQFAHVTSPLAANTSWALFFQQLNQTPQSGHGITGNAMMSQQILGSYGVQGPQVNILPGHEGVDLYYHAIGKRTLARGDSLALITRKEDADYERIVEWLIPDHRDVYGNPVQRPGADPETGDALDAPWDALRFKNPFPFPMTTGPALVLAHGRFSGQRMTNWVNAGEETTVRVTKALSLRTRSVEHEQQNGNGASQRDIVDIGGRRFRRATVEGELSICNHRAAPVKLLIRRRFSGDLHKAAEGPKVTLLEEGVYSVNKRNELVWTLTLKPGEEKTLPYQYAVLVNF